jgi:hypothetical protein
MTIDIRVVLTGKCARATVVYVDREQPRFCGVSLQRLQNIWGILLPPDDWPEGDLEGVPDECESDQWPTVPLSDTLSPFPLDSFPYVASRGS